MQSSMDAEENIQEIRARAAGIQVQVSQMSVVAALHAIVAHGGTISHQHGVGVDHAPYLSAEKGTLGMEVIRDLCRRFDPQGIMNPGKLLPYSIL